MVIYIAGKDQKIVSKASSSLPEGGLIIDDQFTDEVETGVKTLDITLALTDELRENAVPGNFILYGDNDYLMFQITEVERDSKAKTIRVYGEDAGIDLLHRICGSWTATKAMSLSGCVDTVLGSNHMGWKVSYNVNSSATADKSNFDYSSDETALARLQSIAGVFDCEMFYSYEIDGMQWVSRTINFVKARGSQTPAHTFIMGQEISNITETANIEDLATSFVLYGKKNNKKTALSKMPGYSTYSGKTYKPDDTSTFSYKRNHTYKVTGNSVRCVDMMEYWANDYDTDGLIEVVKETDYKNIKSLISYAIKELEKVVDTVYEYEVSFNSVPEGVETGDYVRIVDENNELYLKSRILKIESSEIRKEYNLTLGDFTLLKGSKAQQMDVSNLFTLSITSSNGLVATGSITTTLIVTLFKGGEVITEASGLDSTDSLQWYIDGVAVDSSDERISNDGFTFNVDSQTDNKTYRCELIRDND